MLIQNEQNDNWMWCIKNLTQDCRPKKKHNPLHETDFQPNNYTHIDTLSQVKLIENGAVRRAWIVH